MSTIFVICIVSITLAIWIRYVSRRSNRTSSCNLEILAERSLHNFSDAFHLMGFDHQVLSIFRILHKHVNESVYVLNEQNFCKEDPYKTCFVVSKQHSNVSLNNLSLKELKELERTKYLLIKNIRGFVYTILPVFFKLVSPVIDRIILLEELELFGEQVSSQEFNPTAHKLSKLITDPVAFKEICNNPEFADEVISLFERELTSSKRGK
jgi:hypothetical protein